MSGAFAASRRDILATLLALGLPAGASAQGRTAVRVGYVPVIGASALFVLVESGAAAAAGLDVTLAKFDTGAAAIQALASGTFDFMMIGIAPIAVARAKGLDARVVASASTAGSGFVVTPGLGDAFEAAGGKPAEALAAFRAKTGRPAKLATLPPGGVPNVLLNYWLFKTHAVAPADVTIVSMGIEAMQGAILAKAIDGGTVLEPALTIVQARDPKLKLIATGAEMFPHIPGVVLAATGAFAKAHPAALDQMIRLTVGATDMIRNDPQRAAGFVQKVLGGGLVDVALIAKSLTSPAVGFVTDPREIEAATKAMLDYEVTLGDFPTAPSTDGLFDLASYDRAVKGG